MKNINGHTYFRVKTETITGNSRPPLTHYRVLQSIPLAAAAGAVPRGSAPQRGSQRGLRLRARVLVAKKWQTSL